MEARLREQTEPLTHTYRAVTAVHAAETVKHVYPTACVILQVQFFPTMYAIYLVCDIEILPLIWLKPQPERLLNPLLDLSLEMKPPNK
jgi:hypothetical protein